MMSENSKQTARFVKMHGLGNDYIYFDCTRGNNAAILAEPEKYAVTLSDRRFGVGGDGIILLCDAEGGSADFRMRMFNADGSEGKMCGNGIRCLAKFAYDLGLTDKRGLFIETLSGIKSVGLIFDGDTPVSARVDMGAPSFDPASLPVAYKGEAVIDAPLVFASGREEICTCVSVGNPHCVIFTEDIGNYPLEQLGKDAGASAGLFPEGINVEIAHVLPDGSIEMRVWERGSGETFACGTGACAVFASAFRTGRLGDSREAVMKLRGGELLVEINYRGHIFMTGGAETVYSGEVLI